MRRAQDVRKQLVDILERHKHPIFSAGRNYNLVRQALCAGFFRNVARKDPQEGYKTVVEGTPCYIHPSSALFGKSAEWVIYHELVMTGREYMREATVVEAKWLVEAAPTFFKVADATQLSKRTESRRESNPCSTSLQRRMIGGSVNRRRLSARLILHSSKQRLFLGWKMAFDILS